MLQVAEHQFLPLTGQLDLGRALASGEEMEGRGCALRELPGRQKESALSGIPWQNTSPMKAAVPGDGRG